MNPAAGSLRILYAWPFPLLIAIALGAGMPFLSSACAVLAGRLFRAPIERGFNLPFLYVQHGFQLLFALAAITILKRPVPADYGLHWPRGKTYIGPAVLWGIFFGFLMTVVGFAPQILAHKAPELDYPLTARNMLGWLTFEGVYVGPTEEIPFRALLVTYLAKTMPPGRARLGGYEMHQAGVVVALIFALAHANTFLTSPWPLALAQQLWAFALGVLYAYWLEKSGSIVASAIAHNVGDGVAYVLMYLWVGLAPNTPTG